MASAPMNPTPFFGSKISLISKSEIRYEGILYTVDPKESTIALAQVRSFGSEDRIVDKPVPPRDEIFQYIIFRASDIKDLIVDQPPSPALTDPAIIQAHSTTSQTFPSSFPQPSASINAVAGQAAGATASTSLQQQLQQAGIQNAAAAVAASMSSSKQPSTSQQSVQPVTSVQDPSSKQTNKPSTSNAQVVAPCSSSNSQQGSKPINKQLPQRTNHAANQMNRNAHQQNRNQEGSGGNTNAFMANRPNNFNRRLNVNTRGNPMNGFQQRNGGPQSFNRTSFSNRFQQHGHRQPSGVGGFNTYNRRQNNRNFVSNRQNHHAKPSLSLPDSDFDFEKAQDEFKQLEEKLANLKVNGDAITTTVNSNEATTTNNEPALKTEIESASKDPCYNKEKSFFDKISCEALERERGNVQRVDWKAERKLNRETFGVVAPMRRNGYRPNNRFGGGGGYRGYQQNYRSRSGQRTNQGSGNVKPNGVTNVSSATAASAGSTSTAGSTTVVVAASSNLVSPAKN